jgi:hypothetical protein
MKLAQFLRFQDLSMLFSIALRQIMHSLHRVESSAKISSQHGSSGSVSKKLITYDYVRIQQSSSSTSISKISKHTEEALVTSCGGGFLFLHDFNFSRIDFEHGSQNLPTP